MISPPVALTIAGSDNSAGAGLQADLKTFCAHGVYGITAVTCVVAEVPGKVSAIQAIDPEVLREQIRLSLAGFPVAAAKTGMLYSRELIAIACEELAGTSFPLVVDPVMIATSRDRLLQDDAIALYEERLFPMAAVVTPNLDEAAALLGHPITSSADMEGAAADLVLRYGVPFLLKGGHLRGEVALDLLATPGDAHKRFSAERLEGVSTHGTGCTYSAAIAATLAKGLSLRDAVAAAKQYVHRSISSHFRWKHGSTTVDALNHSA